MIGHIVGSYKITEKIGEGGMGAVFRGIDLMLEREVAIKVLRPELATQSELVERFRAEAVTLAKLNHPNVATLYSFVRQGDDLFMVMEFVRGETLDTSIRRSGALDWKRAIPLFLQALDGISHAHRLGIVHRDIKPANMMLTDAGSIKVMDFGIARVLGTARMTRAGHLIGTVEYMSPEQIQGQETDARSDIYSLGILLYEMLTGRVPFLSDSEYEIMRSHVERVPPSPRELTPEIPVPVEDILMRALAKEPAARIQTVEAFRRALEDAMRASLAATGRSHQTDRPSGVPPTQVEIEAGPGSDEDLKPTRLAHQATLLETEISLPGVEAAPRSGEAPGETRVAGDEGLLSPAVDSQIKETRLAQPGLDEPAPEPGASGRALFPAEEGQPPTSLLGKLTWKHYTGAIAAVVILAGVGLGFLLSGNEPPTPPTLNESSPDASPNASTPLIEPPSTADPTSVQSASPSGQIPPDGQWQSRPGIPVEGSQSVSSHRASGKTKSPSPAGLVPSSETTRAGHTTPAASSSTPPSSAGTPPAEQTVAPATEDESASGKRGDDQKESEGVVKKIGGGFKKIGGLFKGGDKDKKDKQDKKKDEKKGEKKEKKP